MNILLINEKFLYRDWLWVGRAARLQGRLEGTSIGMMALFARVLRKRVSKGVVDGWNDVHPHTDTHPVEPEMWTEGQARVENKEAISSIKERPFVSLPAFFFS